MAFTDTSSTRYKKIILVRVQHAEHKPSSTSLGSGVYEYDVSSRQIHRVTRNGVDMTEVSSTPTSNDEFWHDEDNSKLVVKTASAPNSTDNVIIIYTYLFYTNERARAIAETPTSAVSVSNPLRDWEPKVANVPTFRQSIKNNLSGILSTSSSSIDIINTDNELNPLVGLNNSFGNKIIDIWLGLDGTDNIDKIYSGIITGVRISDSICTFRVNDITGRLDAQAWMGDDEDESIHSLIDNSTLDPEFDQSPKFFYIGPSTRYTPIIDTSITGISDAERPLFQSLESGVNTNRSDTVSATTNRNWYLGRSFNGPIAATSTISSITAGGFGSDYLTFTPGATTGGQFTVGQTCTITGSPETRVVKVTSGGDVTVAWSSGDATPAVSTAVTGHAITVYINGVRADGKPTLLSSSSISSTSTTSTSGGNQKTSITFADDFESSTSDFGANKLNPEIHFVGFIMTFAVDDETDAPVSHENVLEKILERANMTGTANLPSFTDNSSISTDLQFSIPFFDELDYSNYRAYIERLLITTNGVLYTGVDEIVYNTIALPTTQTPTVSTNDTLERSRFLDIDYRDISYITTGFNPHSPISESGEASNKHKYLHDSEDATRFRHIAVELNSTVSDLRSKINRNRKASYTHETFARDLDSSPSDNLTLEHDVTPDPTGTTDVFITEVEKSTTKVSVKSSDLLDD